ncbi:MAG: hypothetical protein H6656_16280 [Ardenticatenaceae bacterium]|nr:hypothetical protein [Ardenticatenaceae bacterium]
MKKYLILLLLTAVLMACDGPAGGDSDLPTLVPTIAVQESGNQAEPLDEDEQSDSAPDVEESSVVDEAASGQTAEGESEVNLDDSLLYNEPLDIDYRTTLEFYMTVEGERVGYVFADGRRTISPNASTMTFNMEGNAGGGLGETMTVTQIEDAFYYAAPPNDCISLAGQSGFENPFALFLDTGGFLTEEAERVLPDETINGVDSYHYELSQDNLLSWSVYDIYDADLYIAKEGGFVVRLLITGFGINEVVSGDAVQEGDIYYELNNIPESVSAITIPDGCEDAATIASDYPVMDDATAVISGPGVFSYETQNSFEDVIAFYKETLTANNEWAIAQEIVLEPNASITFTGAGGTLMVNLGPGQNGGVQVGIIATP